MCLHEVVLEKLGVDLTTEITLGERGGNSSFNCASTSLNELLEALFVNISDNGLHKLEFFRFPAQCDLDTDLFRDIA